MEILIILLLIMFNGLFSMSEIALLAVKKPSLQSEAKKGNKAAKIALKIAEEPNTFLSTVQIGITLIGILTGIYSGETLDDDLIALFQKMGMKTEVASALAQPLIVVVVTYMSIVFGELVPKKIGLTMSNRIAKFVSPLMRFLSIIASPFVWLLAKSTQAAAYVLGINDSDSRMTEEDIKNVIEEGKLSGEVEEVEQDIMERVFALGDRTVDTIMTHKSDVVWIDKNDPVPEIKKTVGEDVHQIYPVCDGNIDSIIGIVYLKDLFGEISKPDFSLEKCTKPAIFFHENMGVFKMLDSFKVNGGSFGIVCDEYGTMQGIVTHKDVLEALLGSLPEEVGEEDIIERKEGGWFVDGQCSIYKFLAYFDMEEDYEPGEYNTVSGLILEKLEHIPSCGESIDWNTFHLEIVDMDGPRIDKLLATRIELPEKEEEEQES